ncbi:MAG: hypothetical protein ACK4UN_02630, partial [Limisphaerales bacterium]
MSISRVTKAIAVMRREQRFSNAEDIRKIDVDIYLPATITLEASQMAQVAVALVLRCFTGNLRVHGVPEEHSVKATLQSEARKVGGIERLQLKPNNVGEWRLALCHRRDGAVSADVSGWNARMNGTFTERIPAAAPAIAFSVACVIAKLFSAAILGNHKNFLETWDFCLLRFGVNEIDQIAVPSNVNLGRVALLGAGAIGSAAGYILS